MKNNHFTIEFIYNIQNNIDSGTSLVQTFFPSILGIIGVLVGAWITDRLQKRSKNHETKITALTTANFVAIMLVQKFASLKAIALLLETLLTTKSHQKNIAVPSILKLEENQISKLLSFSQFCQRDYVNVIQSLLAAEQSYKNCFDLVLQYNKTIEIVLILQCRGKSLESENLLSRFEIELMSYTENIDRNYKEASNLNRLAKEKFDAHCNIVFNKKNKKEYKPLIGDSIVEASKLFDDDK